MTAFKAFRLVGDFLHVAAMVQLLVMMIKTKNCQGLSLKTQGLYLMVYLTRYIDLINMSPTLYLNAMKVLFISISLAVVLLFVTKFKSTYERTKDTFLYEAILAICFVLAFLKNYDVTFIEICWAFSIYLEAFAMLPQFYMILFKNESTRWWIFLYISLMGLYRGFYIINWVLKNQEEGTMDAISFTGGTTGTVLLVLFCVVYVIKSKCLPKRNDDVADKSGPYIISNDITNKSTDHLYDDVEGKAGNLKANMQLAYAGDVLISEDHKNFVAIPVDKPTDS